MPADIRLLGRLEVTNDGRLLDLGRRRERCLLGVLALEAGRSVPIERLLDLLWDEDPPPTARASLHTHVARLRSRLDPGGAGGLGIRLLRDEGGYRADLDRELVDAHRFRALTDRARAEPDPRRRADLLRQAIALWRGPLLDDDASPRLRDRIGAELAERRVAATELMIDTELASGRHRELIGELTVLTAEQPRHERFTAQLMIALHRAGRQPEALDAYQRLRAWLADNLGLDPAREIQDLHTAVLRHDPGLAAPPAPPAARPAQLPIDVRGFTGRAAPLAHLDALAERAGDPATGAVIAVLSGSAGVGKTALAVHWAHRVADRFPDGQLYANLRGFDPSGSPMSPAEAVRGFLDAYGVPAQRIPAGLDAQIGLYRSVLAGKRVLIVLDNALDADQVRPLLPGSGGCFVAVTSRNPLGGLVAAEGAHPVPLSVLRTDEARALLARRLGGDRVAAAAEAVDELVARCARLPLALAIVAARAAGHPDAPLATFSAELRQAHSGLDAFTGEDETTDLRTVFSWSHRAVGGKAAHLFRLLGLHPGPDVSVPAAASLVGSSVPEVRPLFVELSRAHLLAEHLPGRYTFHDLLRAYAAELATTMIVEDQRAAQRRLFDHYVRTAYAADRQMSADKDPFVLGPAEPDTTPEKINGYDEAAAWFTAEHAVLNAAIERAAGAGFDAQAWRLASTLTTFLDRRGHWSELAALQGTALAAAQRLGDSLGEARTRGDLAHAQVRLGRYDDAYANLDEALRLLDGLDQPMRQAVTHMRYGWALELQGRQDESYRHAREALDLFEAAGHRAGAASALGAIGWHHARTGDPRQALAYCERALALHGELDNRYGVGATWDSLGYIHHQLGDYARAGVCYEEALAIQLEMGDRSGEADVLAHLGDTRDAAGDVDGARRAWHRALDIFRQLGHADAAAVRARLDRDANVP